MDSNAPFSPPPPPLRAKGKDDREITLRQCGRDDQAPPSLQTMYREFQPKLCAQGLPPEETEQICGWVEHLLSNGTINLIAEIEGKIVGHCVLLECRPGELCEYVVFVHQRYQNLGIGTALTETAIQRARALGFQKIWLTVGRLNRRAIRVYEKAGFAMLGMEDGDCEMCLELSNGCE